MDFKCIYFGGRRGGGVKKASILFNSLSLDQTLNKSQSIHKPNFPDFQFSIFENVGEEIWSICARNVWLFEDLLLFWQDVHIFSQKCPQTRFARFADFFRSALDMELNANYQPIWLLYIHACKYGERTTVWRGGDCILLGGK